MLISQICNLSAFGCLKILAISPTTIKSSKDSKSHFVTESTSIPDIVNFSEISSIFSFSSKKTSKDENDINMIIT